MAYDGSIIFDTEINQEDFEKGIKEIEEIVKKLKKIP